MFFPFRDDNPTTRPATVTYTIVAINVLALLWLSRQPELEQVVAVHRYGFVPARVAQLVDPKPIQVPVEELVQNRFGVVVARRGVPPLEANPGQIVLSWLTSMFLHGGWLHLVGNMWFLVIFGNNVEDRLGHLTYLVLYVLGGLTAAAFHWAGNPSSVAPVIGASGAVAAILGAYAITWPWARVRTLVFLFIFITIIDLPALLVLGVWFLTQLLNATHQNVGVGENVAWWAHVGGFVAGAFLMPLMSSLVVSRPPKRLGAEPDQDFQNPF